MKDKIARALQKATGEKEVYVECPEIAEHGDYATNIAMAIFSKPKLKTQKSKFKSARELAEDTVEKLKKDKALARIVSKIEVAGLPVEASAKAGPAFINLWLSEKALTDILKEVIKKGEKYGSSDYLKGKNILLEHTSPNTIKTLHVGHVRNNVLGMAVHNILEFSGAKVVLDAINNDRGIHVMKAVWAYQKYGKGESPKRGEKLDHFVDRFYIKGAKEGEEKKTKDEMQTLLQKWEAGDKTTCSTWKKLRDWTFQGFLETYKRLGSHHDHQWFESDFYEEGKKIVEEGLKKDVFKKLPDGAVLSNLEKYGLPDTIILRADGTSMYHTQDLRLTQLKREKFPSDLYIWDIGPEQSLYLKQLFAMCEQLGIGKVSDYYHLSYGYVFLKSGEKMSSRKGKIVSSDWLMEEMVGRARKIIEESKTPLRSERAGRGLPEREKKEVAEKVGIGAIKYGFLKVGRETDVYFDLDESLSLEGNSGPYLQYTVARANSVLRRVRIPNSKFQIPKDIKLNNEELAVLRAIPKFSEVIEDAAKNYAPNLLCNYLFDLAQKYNAFYNAHRILDLKTPNLPSEPEALKGRGQRSKTPIASHKSQVTSDFRVALTFATGQILKNGLVLLGIGIPDRM